MNRYKLIFILRDGSKIKITSEKISKESLMIRKNKILSNKGPLLIKHGSIEFRFMAKDIKKIKHKVLKYE